MVDIEGGFERGPRTQNPCDDLIQFARPKLEKSISKTVRTGDEIVFGMDMDRNNISYTESIVSTGLSIKLGMVKDIYKDLTKKDPVGGDKCLVHTHTGEPAPSLADIKSITSSLYEEDKLINRDMPTYDCYYILGYKPPDTGMVAGIMITKRPSKTEYIRIANKIMNAITKEAAKKNPVVQNVYSTFSNEAGEYIYNCQSKFTMTEKPGRRKT